MHTGDVVFYPAIVAGVGVTAYLIWFQCATQEWQEGKLLLHIGGALLAGGVVSYVLWMLWAAIVAVSIKLPRDEAEIKELAALKLEGWWPVWCLDGCHICHKRLGVDGFYCDKCGLWAFAHAACVAPEARRALALHELDVATAPIAILDTALDVASTMACPRCAARVTRLVGPEAVALVRAAQEIVYEPRAGKLPRDGAAEVRTGVDQRLRRLCEALKRVETGYGWTYGAYAQLTAAIGRQATMTREEWVLLPDWREVVIRQQLIETANEAIGVFEGLRRELQGT
jgi:hypothetical protein